MNPFWKMAAPWIGGAAVVMVLGAGFVLYGAHQYRAGADAKQAEIEKRQAAIERGWQEERDRADALHRGAVLARQAVEAKNSALLVDVAAAHERIVGLDGLLKQYRDRAAAAGAGGGPIATGPDWIGVFGECVGRVESLARRLDQVGKDAAGWADQVNGLLGYFNGLKTAK
ncbi:hypothetical protein [Achromobacter dolens]|uniref:hypothetical protein n=1 Tax=Achromobacter dolens TaxID=1287738 RepID=UPI003B9D69E4